ncbi:MAG: 50S ribosomal protein L30 [Vampirovibrionales bacterium]|nr:50S ribosomal protein L30 [Vampirovibrionales bacterium]
MNYEPNTLQKRDLESLVGKSIKITLVRSLLGVQKTIIAVATALGLRKTNTSVQHTATATILGMVHKVRHLVRVEVV